MLTVTDELVERCARAAHAASIADAGPHVAGWNELGTWWHRQLCRLARAVLDEAANTPVGHATPLPGQDPLTFGDDQ